MPRNSPPDIGRKIKQLRSEKNLTLAQLAQMSGVSKSMLSQIERGRTNPTLAILWTLTQSLEIDISDLLNNESASAARPSKITHVKAHQTPEIQSADGKCALKILGPIDLVAKTEWYNMVMEAGGLLESNGHAEGTMEHLTLLDGTLSVRNGKDDIKLHPGDTARYEADIPHYIENTGKKTARALMIVLTP
ncbi:MAG: DNA-binding protein [Alphaproteobacteria bacterium]|nr:MAG: DNA-binding protein [Alphaproteobacteria bacterium]